MDVGFAASIHQPPSWDGRRTFELISRLCRAADEYGFDDIWKGQHFLSDLVNFQPVPLLARLSGELSTAGMGNILLLPLHHPVKAAEYAANLDILTGGNYVCGVALGYRDVEFNALGVPKDERVGRLIEGVQVMRRLWRENAVSYDGRYFTLDEVTINPKPVQDGGPPVWIGGNTEPAIRRAARVGDTWLINPHATFDTIKHQLTAFTDELESQARDPATVQRPLYREALVAEDRETAIRAAAPHLGQKYDKYVEWGQSDAMGDSGELAKAFDELHEDRFLLGSPAEVRDEIARYRDDLEIDYLIVRMYWPDMAEETCLRSIRLFGEEVIPHIRN